MNKTLKKIIILVVIFALVGIGASLFLGDQEKTASQLQSLNTGTTAAPLTQNAVTSTAIQDTNEINREFVAMLLNLESIKLTDDIFSEPAFQALADNTVRLNQPGNQGRPNPFAPIGTDNLMSAGDTLQASAVSALQNQEQDSTGTQDEQVTTTSSQGAEISNPLDSQTSQNQSTPNPDSLAEQLEALSSSLGGG
jgi:hypothetical protein